MPRFGHLSVFREPQCLIKTDDEGKLHVEDGVISEISTIKESLVVVAIAGLYRTGKSFLMNRLTNTQSGFLVGKTTEAKTKGIWVFCRIHPSQENTVLVLLDTEGLGDVKKGDVNHDNKILTLAVLMCNVLCYNILNVFDEDAAERLALDLNGKTEEEYLENCLKSLDGNSEEVQKYNISRSCIRKTFQRRTCFTFDRPAERADLKRLDQLSKTSFSPDFVEDVRKYEKYLYERSPKSVYEDTTFDGFILTSIVRCHIESINSGMVPEVQDALQNACDQANEKQVTKINERFRRELKDIKLPVLSFKRFEEVCSSTSERLLADLKQHLRCDDNKVFERLARRERALQRFLDEKAEVGSRIMMEERRLTKEMEDRQREQIRLDHERRRQESIRRYEEHQREEKAKRERERRKQAEFFRRQEQMRQEMEENARRENERYRLKINRLEEERRSDREAWMRQMENPGENVEKRNQYTLTYTFYSNYDDSRYDDRHCHDFDYDCYDDCYDDYADSIYY